MNRLGLVFVALASASLAREVRHDVVETSGLTIAKTHYTRRIRAEGNLRAVTAEHVVVPSTETFGLPKVASLAVDGAPVRAGDVIVQFDAADARKRLRDARFDLEEADANWRETQIKAVANDRSRADAEALAEQDAAKARVNEATDEAFNSKNDIIESGLSTRLADAALVEAKRARQIDRDVWRSNVEIAAIQRRSSATAVDQARAAFDHLEIRAPRDGIVVLHRNDNGDLAKVGAQLWPDQPIAELPSLDRMEAEVFVLEVDSSGLEVGQAVDVVVASRPDVMFRGSISAIDKVAKPRDLSVPVQYVSVVVSLDRTDREIMKPGQRVKATIALGAEDSIVVPRHVVFERDGKPFVYRHGLHGFEPVDVELGATTLGSVAISRGLVEGDVIAEHDPTHASPSSKTGSADGSAP